VRSRREVKILQELRKSNTVKKGDSLVNKLHLSYIISLHEVYEDSRNLFLVTDLCAVRKNLCFGIQRL